MPKPGEVDAADWKDKALKGEMPDPEWDAKWHAAAAGIWESIGMCFDSVPYLPLLRS